MGQVGSADQRAERARNIAGECRRPRIVDLSDLSMEPPPPFATPQSAGPLGMPVAGTAKRRAVSPTGRVGSYRTRPAANYPRKRAVSACLVCRGRKTKCDNQRPACACPSAPSPCPRADARARRRLLPADGCRVCVQRERAHVDVGRPVEGARGAR